MKKNKVKQVLLLAVGGLTCGVQLLGCYPVVPAYFAAAVLEDVSVFYLTAAMYLGMLCFMPLVAMTKVCNGSSCDRVHDQACGLGK